VKKYIDLSFVLGACLLLVACGGSGSSSSGGGGGSHAGTYRGISNMTISAPGASETDVTSVEFLIQADGTVIMDPGDEFEVRGRMIGSRLLVDVPGTIFNEPGFACGGSFRVDGKVRGDRIEGTISTTILECNKVRFTVTGTFNANRVVQARATIGGGAIRGIGDTIRAVAPL
jgi:hypothetical protein